MNREEKHLQDITTVRLIARLTDMLEYACWYYPDDAIEAKKLVAEADDILNRIRFKEA